MEYLLNILARGELKLPSEIKTRGLFLAGPGKLLGPLSCFVFHSR